MAKHKWDRYAIAAEVRRRGLTLKELSLKAGRSYNICSVALQIPFAPSGEKAISDFLQIPPQELWPDRYFPNGERKVFSYRSYYNNQKPIASQCLNEVSI